MNTDVGNGIPTLSPGKVCWPVAGALLCAALLGGCATSPPGPGAPTAGDERAECLEVFRRVDAAVERAGVGDGMAARVAGFPYLRVNRFLASYAPEVMDYARFADWMQRMVALGTEAYAVELSNLPLARAEELAHDLWQLGAHRAWPRSAVAACTERLAVLDAGDSARRAALRAGAGVPDDYTTWQRIVGLYWLTRVPFASGVRRWHEETRAVYAQPLDRLQVRGQLRAFVPPPGRFSRDEVRALMERASANPLGVPDPTGEDREALFRAYAPGFVVDVASDADEPGDLGWGATDAPQVVSRRPVVYRRLSHARYAGRTLLQLNYAIWFPARPREGGWDLLGGQLDGVLWRVTLAPDGAPWVFDTIHLCGCYHLFFPTERAVPKAQPDTLDERAFVPQALERAAPGSRMTLRLEAGTHYVQRVTLDAAAGAPAFEYVFAEEDALRSLPLPAGGRRSAFRPDGIVPGTERGERYLFWPMGIPEPGAMRQWGRHATAFVGRRHFDDPGLLERYFILRGANGE